ncbi:MAG: PAS domain S-box protein [Thermoplasmatota archaeon]
MRELERPLAETEEKLRAMCENLPIGVYQTTPDGRILFANRALLDMLGFESFEELAKRNLEEEGFEPAYLQALFKEEIERDGEIRGLEVAWKKKDGSTVHVRKSARAVRGRDGRTIYYEGTAEDITDKRKAEESLRESEERFRTLARLAPETLFETDARGNLTFINDEALSRWGYTMDQLDSGLSAFQMLAPGDRERALERFKRVMAGERLEPTEYTSLARDGREIPILLYSSPLVKGGEVVGIRAIAVDISWRKRRELELKEREELLRAVIDAYPGPVFIKDRENRVVRANAGAEELLGAPEAELVGRRFSELFPEESAMTFWEEDRAVMELGAAMRGMVRPVNTSTGVRWFLTEKLPWRSKEGAVVGVISFSLDVTESKRTEDAFKESVRRYRDLFENLPIGIYRTTPEGKVLMANPALVKMLGFSSFGELRKLDLERRALSSYSRAEFRERLDREGEVIGLEAVWTRKDGTPLYVRESAHAIRGKNGEVLYYEGTLEDITEKRRAEEELARQKELLERIMETSPAGVMMMDSGGRVSYVNPRAEKILCGKSGTLIGRSYESPSWSFTDLLNRPLIGEENPFRRVMETRKPLRDLRLATRTYTGERVLLSLNAAPLLGADGSMQGVVFSLEDITRTFEAEERLKASLSEKEALLKEIHHRVKNNLQVIISLLSLQSRTVRDETALSAFRESQDRVAAMALVHESLYRSSDLARIDFAQYVRDFVTTLVRSQGIEPDVISLRIKVENIHLPIDAAVPCGLIINELVTNCIKHAFPDGRRGEIAIELHRLGDGRLRLRVSDNGTGLREGLDIRSAGTLGLQIVSTLAEQLQGSLEAESEKDRGTSFTVVFKQDGDGGGRDGE